MGRRFPLHHRAIVRRGWIAVMIITNQ
jgi:hypothetical protein